MNKPEILPGTLVSVVYEGYLSKTMKIYGEDPSIISKDVFTIDEGTTCFVLARYGKYITYLLAPECVGWDIVSFYDLIN
jgi:hypothetical protein